MVYGAIIQKWATIMDFLVNGNECACRLCRKSVGDLWCSKVVMASPAEGGNGMLLNASHLGKASSK